MASETQVATAIVSSSDLTSPVVGDVNTDDTTYTTWDGGGNTNILVSFNTPTGNPNTGAGLQTHGAIVQRNASGGASGMTSELWVYESGSDTIGAAVATDAEMADPPGETVTGTWDATNLGTADGSAVELYYVQTARGTGNPSQIRGVEHDYLYWDVDYSATVNETATAPLVTVTVTEQAVADVKAGAKLTPAANTVTVTEPVIADAKAGAKVTVGAAVTVTVTEPAATPAIIWKVTPAANTVTVTEPAITDAKAGAKLTPAANTITVNEPAATATGSVPFGGLDDFNRANQELDSSSNWANIDGFTHNISSNQVTQDGATNTDHVDIYTGQTFADDQFVEFEVITEGRETSAVLRGQNTAGKDYYAVAYLDDSGGSMAIYSSDNSVWTQVGSTVTGVGTTLPFDFRAEAFDEGTAGVRIIGFYDGVAKINELHSTATYTAGYPGIHLYDDGTDGFGTVDNFDGGDLDMPTLVDTGEAQHNASDSDLNVTGMTSTQDNLQVAFWGHRFDQGVPRISDGTDASSGTGSWSTPVKFDTFCNDSSDRRSIAMSWRKVPSGASTTVAMDFTETDMFPMAGVVLEFSGSGNDWQLDTDITEPSIRANTGNTVTSITGSTFTLNKPTGTAEGDQLVAFVALYDNGSSIDPATGFTQRAYNGTDGSGGIKTTYQYVFTKTAGASEPSSYDFTANNGEWVHGFMVAVQDAPAWNTEWVITQTDWDSDNTDVNIARADADAANSLGLNFITTYDNSLSGATLNGWTQQDTEDNDFGRLLYNTNNMTASNSGGSASIAQHDTTLGDGSWSSTSVVIPPNYANLAYTADSSTETSRSTESVDPGANGVIVSGIVFRHGGVADEADPQVLGTKTNDIANGGGASAVSVATAYMRTIDGVADTVDWTWGTLTAATATSFAFTNTAAGGSTATAPLVTTTITKPAATPKAGAKVTPAANSITVAEPAATPSVSHTQTAPLVTVTVTEPAATPKAGAKQTPALNTVTITEPAATPKAGAKITVGAAVAVTVTEPASTLKAGAKLTPAANSITVTEPSATPKAGAKVTPAANTVTIAHLAATASIPGVTAIAELVAVTVTIPSVTDVKAGAKLTPPANAVTVTEPVATPKAGAKITVAVDTVTITEPAATPKAGAKVTPAVDTVTITEPAATPKAGAKVTPAANTVTITIPQASATLPTALVAQAELVAVTITKPSATPKAGAKVTPAVDTVTVTEPVATVKAGAKLTPAANTVTVTHHVTTLKAGAYVDASPTELNIAHPLSTPKAGAKFTTPVVAVTVTEPAATIKAGAKVTPAANTVTVTVYALAGWTISHTVPAPSYEVSVTIPQANATLPALSEAARDTSLIVTDNALDVVVATSELEVVPDDTYLTTTL